MTTRLQLAVQNKGRMGRLIPPLLEQAGLNFQIGERTLLALCENFPLDLLFVRHRDIPIMLERGAADLGIVGSDLLDEEAIMLERLLPLGLARSKLALAVPDNAPYLSAGDLQGKTIATHFPNLVGRWFQGRGIQVDIELLKGSVEIAPRIGLADAIVDLVGTGTTLQVNQLRVLEILVEAEAIVVSGNSLSREKQTLTEQLLLRIKSVIDARGKKLLVINLPAASLDALKALNPGLSGPTVTDINGGVKDMLAVQIVVDEANSWAAISQIKAIGGSGILVMDIERLVS